MKSPPFKKGGRGGISRPRRLILAAILLPLAALAAATWGSLRPLPDTLRAEPGGAKRLQVRDRTGVPLSVTYENDWNLHDAVPLHEVPPLLRQAFVVAEDRRFYSHNGVDWRGRLHAVVQNARAMRGVRGASTISEQAVRLLHPRPRTLWSRWVEGFEAAALERRFGKDRILEFYLNQVPFAARRRGVVQAARYWFDRDLSTLSPGEMLALAVAVRAPGRLDLHRDPEALRARVRRLAAQMKEEGFLPPAQSEAASLPLSPRRSALPVRAGHFVRYLAGRDLPPHLRREGRLDATLDASLQGNIQAILDARLKDLAPRQVGDGAVLVADHRTGEIVAWVNGGDDSPGTPGSRIDAILSPRQPGSTLKPFLYALALEDGWSAATLIDDSPLAGPVGTGLHNFRNYSRRHYGPLPLRDCLGNSLNIPAVRTIQFVRPERFLPLLHRLGFATLDRPADWYGLGLALGNGEVTLLELVRAYAALASGGTTRPLAAVLGEQSGEPRRIFTEESASLIADILSDPEARRFEFGAGGLLNLPVQTAVKTGTSTDYRDAWAVGFNHRYVVGVWMGNLDRRPMREVTGSAGPALVLRSVFAELNRGDEGERLFLSPRLAAVETCRTSGAAARPGCPLRQEWFPPDSTPSPCTLDHGNEPPEPTGVAADGSLHLQQPTPGLHLAMDPRIPDHLEAFAFELPPGVKPERVEWLVDGKVAGTTGAGERRWLWPLRRGRHTVVARVKVAGGEVVMSEMVGFGVR